MMSKRIVLHFPQRLVDKPIVSKLVKDYNLEFNILKASVTPEEEGLLILGLKGKEADYRRSIKYLKKAGVRVQSLAKDITRDDKRCSGCGVCVPICPTNALSVNPNTSEVDFDKEKCIACELCIKVCPVRAMKVRF